MNYTSLPIQDIPKKTFDHSAVHSVPHFVVSCPSLSKSINLKAESPPQLFHDCKYLGLQLTDQESSSAQSIGQSHNKMGAVEGSNYQDQCISSDSGHDESCRKGVEGQMKPIYLLGSSEIVFNQANADYNHSMAHTSYPYSDRYFGGLFSPYGPQALIHSQIGSQVVGIAPARVPLPLDPAEDGPIYVNPKQYHGILRRRQSRAKLEAQKRLAKNRKPYLHESRHLHALSRVRGPGGRFLGTKKLQQPDPNSTSSSNGFSDSTHLGQKNSMSKFESDSGTVEYVASTTTCSDLTCVSRGDVNIGQPDRGFPGISVNMGVAMQNSGRLKHSGMEHCTSAVR